MRKIKIKWKNKEPSYSEAKYRAAYVMHGPGFWTIGIVKKESTGEFYWSQNGTGDFDMKYILDRFSELIKDLYGVEMERTI